MFAEIIERPLAFAVFHCHDSMKRNTLLTSVIALTAEEAPGREEKDVDTPFERPCRRRKCYV
jgi:hypothetical protein